MRSVCLDGVGGRERFHGLPGRRAGSVGLTGASVRAGISVGAGAGISSEGAGATGVSPRGVSPGGAGGACGGPAFGSSPSPWVSSTACGRDACMTNLTINERIRDTYIPSFSLSLIKLSKLSRAWSSSLAYSASSV